MNFGFLQTQTRPSPIGGPPVTEHRTPPPAPGTRTPHDHAHDHGHHPHVGHIPVDQGFPPHGHHPPLPQHERPPVLGPPVKTPGGGLTLAFPFDRSNPSHSFTDFASALALWDTQRSVRGRHGNSTGETGSAKWPLR
jgi:hypothetical protein